jgi:hypothetical protein
MTSVTYPLNGPKYTFDPMGLPWKRTDKAATPV